jgi:DNA-binding NtrC family response regulator
MANGQTALLISPAPDDEQTLSQLFGHKGWILRVVTSLSSARTLLSEKKASVVITERDLPEGNWKNVLELTYDFPDHPMVIVISPLADEFLWAEALNLGAYDVLAKPLDQNEVTRTLSLAWNRAAGW